MPGPCPEIAEASQCAVTVILLDFIHPSARLHSDSKIKASNAERPNDGRFQIMTTRLSLLTNRSPKPA